MELDFGKSGGLIPAVIQDHHTNEVLMLGFVNRESLAKSQQTGEVHFFSRSRSRIWKKGESSGHVLRVQQVLVDCDVDALLIRVALTGPGVCHEGYRSCFFRELTPEGNALTVAEKTFDAGSVYGAKESA